MSFLFLSLYVLLLNGDTEAPRLAAHEDWIVAAPPVELLKHPQVQQNLSSGLTTTIRLQVEAKQNREWQQGGALIDIRFEPWDEVYFISYAAMDGVLKSDTLESEEALHQWWAQLRLRVLPWESHETPPTDVRAILEVVPFSASEQNEARQWFANNSAISNSPESTEATSGLAEPGLINLIVATSIKRKVILRQRWRTVEMVHHHVLAIPSSTQ